MTTSRICLGIGLAVLGLSMLGLSLTNLEFMVGFLLFVGGVTWLVGY